MQNSKVDCQKFWWYLYTSAGLLQLGCTHRFSMVYFRQQHSKDQIFQTGITSVCRLQGLSRRFLLVLLLVAFCIEF
jgi:hypothetical protein